MIKKIVMVIGLPGSGKTEYVKQNQAANTVVIDDPKKIGDLHISYDKSLDTLVIVDHNLCDKKVRDIAKAMLTDYYGDVTFEYAFFENDPEQCIINDRLRGRDNLATTLIRKFAEIYDVPENAKIIPVWQ
jgi:hypothetical protein